MRISSTLLKIGALSGLTLAQIGQILCRPDDNDESPSRLEELVEKATAIVAKKKCEGNELGTLGSPEKKTVDDWELTNACKDETKRFKQSLFDSIGDNGHNSAVVRSSRTYTTENPDCLFDLKIELGRQTVPDLEDQADKGPFNEEFFSALEILIKELVNSI